MEAFEDSDDGDGEGRELDYISDSTDSEPENINLDSVAEEKALRYTSHLYCHNFLKFQSQLDLSNILYLYIFHFCKISFPFSSF